MEVGKGGAERGGGSGWTYMHVLLFHYYNFLRYVICIKLYEFTSVNVTTCIKISNDSLIAINENIYI